MARVASLLALDPERRTFRTWEAAKPCPPHLDGRKAADSKLRAPQIENCDPCRLRAATPSVKTDVWPDFPQPFPRSSRRRWFAQTGICDRCSLRAAMLPAFAGA